MSATLYPPSPRPVSILLNPSSPPSTLAPLPSSDASVSSASSSSSTDDINSTSLPSSSNASTRSTASHQRSFSTHRANKIQWAPLPDPRKLDLIDANNNELAHLPHPLTPAPPHRAPTPSYDSEFTHQQGATAPPDFDDTASVLTLTPSIVSAPSTPSKKKRFRSLLNPFGGRKDDDGAYESDSGSGKGVPMSRSTSTDSTHSVTDSITSFGASLVGGAPLGRTKSNPGPMKSGSQSRKGQRMLNGRVYGGPRNHPSVPPLPPGFSNARNGVAARRLQGSGVQGNALIEPEFVEWGYGGMGSTKSSTSTTGKGSKWDKVQSGNRVAVGAVSGGGAGDDDDDGSGLAWVRKRREERERKKREEEEENARREKVELKEGIGGEAEGGEGEGRAGEEKAEAEAEVAAAAGPTTPRLGTPQIAIQPASPIASEHPPHSFLPTTPFERSTTDTTITPATPLASPQPKHVPSPLSLEGIMAGTDDVDASKEERERQEQHHTQAVRVAAPPHHHHHGHHSKKPDASGNATPIPSGSSPTKMSAPVVSEEDSEDAAAPPGVPATKKARRGSSSTVSSTTSTASTTTSEDDDGDDGQAEKAKRPAVDEDDSDDDDEEDDEEEVAQMRVTSMGAGVEKISRHKE